MIEPKIIFSCNHIITKVNSRVYTEIKIKSGSDEDVISTDFSVPKIFSIYEYNGLAHKFVKYKNNIDFVLNRNSVKWISSHRPKKDTEFFVEYQANSRISSSPENAKDCPRCAGNGWYVSILSEQNKSIDKVSGINKLVQGFIKVLYTRKTEDSNYGTDLTLIPGRETYSEEEAVSLAVQAVADAEYQYKSLQLDTVSAGYNIPDSEMLNSASVTNAEYDSNENTMYLEITLISLEPNQIAQIAVEFN